MKTANREGQLTTLLERTLGRYEITAFIGAGGMGEVYRARDTQLGREVALKILPESFASEVERLRRFEDEARAVARLSHPNIMTIHDFGTEDGITYAVMELLEGESLRQRLQRGPIPVRKAIDIASQIADGLSAAHHGRVVHRDIKPENVFLTSGGQVKILDFGIAHLREEVSGATRTLETEETVTDDVRAAGTLAYMSPEQLRGQRVGPTSDIFSLGCVLYEMLTETRPFQRSNSADTVSAILHHDPPPITERRPEAPPVLAHLVTRCLEKQPDERFESARDLAFALRDVSTTDPSSPRFQGPADRRRLRTRRLASAAVATVLIAAAAALAWRLWFAPPPPLPERKHIGVIPFDSDREDPDLQNFAAGLTSRVASGLSLVGEQYRGAFWVVSVDEAEKVGCASTTGFRDLFTANLVVSGRLQAADDELYLDLQVIDPASGRSLRSRSIRDRASNLTSFQEGPVLALANALEVAVDPQVRERLAVDTTTTQDGFSAFVRGLGEANNPHGTADLEHAVELLEQATSLDPLFSAGRVALGWACLRRHEETGLPEWANRAISEAERAVQDSRWPEDAYLLLATARVARSEVPEAVEALQNATRAAPENANLQLAVGDVYRELDRIETAVDHYQRAVFLSPDYWPPHDRLGRLFLSNGDYEAAAIQFQSVIKCAPRLTKGYNNLGVALSYLGRAEEAQAVFERSIEIAPSRSAFSNLGTLYFDQKRFADAAEMFERALEEDDRRHLTWGNLGYAYKFGPSPDKADACFEKAFNLASQELESNPHDLWAATDLASYSAMLGRRQQGLALLNRVVSMSPHSPRLMAQIAETYEDLGQRDAAIVWVTRAFEAGVSPSRFENRPTLRELVADERYKVLAADHAESD